MGSTQSLQIYVHHFCTAEKEKVEEA